MHGISRLKRKKPIKKRYRIANRTYSMRTTLVHQAQQQNKCEMEFSLYNQRIYKAILLLTLSGVFFIVSIVYILKNVEYTNTMQDPIFWSFVGLIFIFVSAACVFWPKHQELIKKSNAMLEQNQQWIALTASLKEKERTYQLLQNTSTMLNTYHQLCVEQSKKLLYIGMWFIALGCTAILITCIGHFVLSINNVNTSILIAICGTIANILGTVIIAMHKSALQLSTSYEKTLSKNTDNYFAYLLLLNIQSKEKRERSIIDLAKLIVAGESRC